MSLATEKEIQHHYAGNDVATKYVENRFVSEVHRLLHDRQVAAVQQLIDGQQPTWILEIAPGPGRIARAVRTNGRLVCLEFNEGMIQQGRAVCEPKTLWVRGNGFRLPFDQAFGLVYSFRFVRHFHRADRDRLYGEIHRVLQPGGLFVMDAVNERVSRPLRAAHPEEYPVYDKLYRQDELGAELAAAGFVVQGLKPVQKFVGLQGLSQNLIGPRSNLVNRWFIRLLERFPRRDGLEWIVICRRA